MTPRHQGLACWLLTCVGSMADSVATACMLQMQSSLGVPSLLADLPFRRVHALHSSLVQSDAGMKGSLGSLQAAVAQLKTAVVALELRPPLGDATSSSADCLQVGGGRLQQGGWGWLCAILQYRRRLASHGAVLPCTQGAACLGCPPT